MLSMQEFSLYDEVPVAFAKIAKYIYYAHSLNLHYNYDGNSYLCTEAKWLMFEGVFESLRSGFGKKEDASNKLVEIIKSFNFGDPDAKFEKEFLLAELNRLSYELRLCYISAERRYKESGEGLANLKAGLQEITAKLLLQKL